MSDKRSHLFVDNTAELMNADSSKVRAARDQQQVYLRPVLMRNGAAV
jgi:hypothetical protein